ncbi:MAG TPA: peptidyl-prolyl cis-trans isomerase [Candidatus Omnitrophota bacterium]|nr:peptidyl-prolyl cis-trans isomerase [Candidatus Omnitrophota bacterium]
MSFNKQKLTVVVGFFLFVFAFGCEKTSSSQTNLSQSVKTKPTPVVQLAQNTAPVKQLVAPPAQTEEKKAVSPAPKEPASPASVAGNVLAKVGSWVLTIEEFKERLAALKEVVPDYDPADVEQNKMILEELIRQQLLVQDAENSGIAKDKDISEAVEEFRRTLLVREVASRLTKDIAVTEEEAQEYYDVNKEEFTEQAQWRARELVVETEEEAKQILVELYQGADFVEKVKEKSKSNSAWQKGDLGLKSEFDFPKMQKVVEALEVGDVSGVFQGPNGYYIVKLEEKQGGEPQNFEDIKEDIITGLTLLKQQQAILEHLEKIRQQTDIQVNLKLLEE